MLHDACIHKFICLIEYVWNRYLSEDQAERENDPASQMQRIQMEIDADDAKLGAA